MAEKSTKSLDLESSSSGEHVKTQKPEKEHKLEKIDFTEKAKCVRDTNPSTHGKFVVFFIVVINVFRWPRV